MGYAKKIRIKIIVIQGMLLFFIYIWNSVYKNYLSLVGIILAMSLLSVSVLWITKPLKLFESYIILMKKNNPQAKTNSLGVKKGIYVSEIDELIREYAKQQIEHNIQKIYDKQTELDALQSQINPHFLYNTLETIRGQALIDDNTEIAIMVEALAMFFRYSISGKGNLVPLRDELTSINNYMIIQKYRFNNRFSLEIYIDEDDKVAYDFFVPRLMIQPIVENAIFHGLEEMESNGKVSIEIILTDKNLIITVSDNGKGMSKELLEKINCEIKKFTMFDDKNKRDEYQKIGIALSNINKRIELLFGGDYGLTVYSTLGQGTDVEIYIPIKRTN